MHERNEIASNPALPIDPRNSCPREDCNGVIREVEETTDDGRVKTSYGVCTRCGRRIEYGA